MNYEEYLDDLYHQRKLIKIGSVYVPNNKFNCFDLRNRKFDICYPLNDYVVLFSIKDNCEWYIKGEIVFKLTLKTKFRKCIKNAFEYIDALTTKFKEQLA